MNRYNFLPNAPVAMTPCPDYSDAAVKTALSAVLEGLRSRAATSVSGPDTEAAP